MQGSRTQLSARSSRMIDAIMSPLGRVVTRWALRVAGWIFASIFFIIVYTLSARYLRSLIAYFGAPWSPPWCLQLSIGAWLVLNVVGNYAWCVFTDPGRLPKASASGNVACTNANAAGTASMAGGRRDPRFCQECGIVPPARAMHCPFCDACVLKMDHHCPWILGCVGYHNHPYFVLYLLYCVLGTVYLSIVSIPALQDASFMSALPDSSRHDVRSVLIISAAAGVLLVAFGGFHTFLAGTNQTSFECIENSCCAKKSGTDHSFHHCGIDQRYNVGLEKNLDDLFGVGWTSRWWRLLLPLPIVRAGDGVTFSIRAPRESSTSDSEQTLLIQALPPLPKVVNV